MSNDTDRSALAEAPHVDPPRTVTELLEAAVRQWVADDPERFVAVTREAHASGLATSSNPFLPEAERAFQRVTGL